MNKVISHHYRLRRQKTAAAKAAAVIVISGLSDGLADPIGCDYAHAVAHYESRVHYRRVAVAVNVARDFITVFITPRNDPPCPCPVPLMIITVVISGNVTAVVKGRSVRGVGFFIDRGIHILRDPDIDTAARKRNISDISLTVKP